MAAASALRTTLAMKPAHELLSLLRPGKVTATELVETYLERIARKDGPINSIITLNPHAREQATKLDDAFSRGEYKGRLHGLPITIKDCFATAGIRTTAGLASFKSHVPETNAVVVQRLLDQGAVILGKTNLPPGVTGQETSNSIFGRTSNTFDLTRTPGGSSGGPAAAVASGFCAFDIGSDAGGSIRQPASFCGLFAHYPTHGLVPIRGHLPNASMALLGKDMDFLGVGPIARSAFDLEVALDVIAGADLDAAKHVQLQLPKDERTELKQFRVAAWLDDESMETDPQVLAVFNTFIAQLKQAGCKVDVKARPQFDFDDARSLAFALWVAASSDHTTSAQLKQLEKLAHSESLPASHLSKLRARAETLRHGSWLHLDSERHQYLSAWHSFFSHYDVLLCPVTPVIAPHHDPQTANDKDIVASLDHRIQLTLPVSESTHRRPYLDMIAWPTVIGMSGLPSTVVPVGKEKESGMPVGMQVVGMRGGDWTTVAFAKAVEGEVGGFVAPEGF